MTYQLKIDVSPIYELISSFLIYTTQKWVNNLDVGSQWIEDAHELISPEHVDKFEAAKLLPFTDYDHLYALAIMRQTDASIPEFLDFLDTQEPAQLATIIASLVPHVNIEDMVRIKEKYTPLLRVWYECYFTTVTDQYVPLLMEDAAEKLTLADKMDMDVLIEYASGGLVLEPEQHVEKVILLPTIHLRPLNTYYFYENLLFIQYPIDLPECDEDEPPISLLRLTRAISKAEYLRLLRYVALGPKSMHEIVDALGITRDELLHELLILRVAGLLRTHLIGQDDEKYSIRPDGVAELPIFLESYIRL
jgi:hypothetical protein